MKNTADTRNSADTRRHTHRTPQREGTQQTHNLANPRKTADTQIHSVNTGNWNSRKAGTGTETEKKSLSKQVIFDDHV